MKRKARALAALGVAILAGAVSVTVGRADDPSSKAALLDWYDLTTKAVGLAGLPEQSSQERIWAVSWLAAARAARHPSDPSYVDAAVATALHDALSKQVPAIAPEADGLLATSLGRIPDGPQKTRGEDAGHFAAAQTLAERAGDGFDTASVDRPWAPPPPAPGVYQLTGGPAVRAGLPDARLFILDDRNRFDPGPPPALDSPRYLSSLAEVQALGGASSTLRTAEQTDVARFWAQSSLVTYTQIVRQVVEGLPGTVSAAVRLVAAFHVIELDQQIAIHTAKYRYLFWRPLTAIHWSDPTSTWQPLISTPRHPEYPSGHAAFGGTADVVLAALAPAEAHDKFSASSATDSGATHTWTGWRAITDETIDARVWEGVHFRFSDETGAALGRAVAGYDLAHLDAIGI